MPTSKVPRLNRVLWQSLALALVLCAAWLMWNESRRQVEVSVREQQIAESQRDLLELDEAAADPFESLHSMEVFARAGRAAVPRLLAELSAEDPEIRALALYGLGRIGPDGAEAVEQVRERLRDENPKVRAKAIVALRCVSNKPLDAAPSVISMLEDSDADVRKTAASELLYIRRSPAEIGELLRNEDPEIVNYGLDQIPRLGDSAAESLPEVLMVLKQEELEDRISMPADAFPNRFFFLTRALSSMKTAARPAIPHLLRLIETRRDSTRVLLAQTLVDIGIEPEELVRALRPLLLDDDPVTVSGIGGLIVQVSRRRPAGKCRF